jgi:uncharacterized protein YhaN
MKLTGIQIDGFGVWRDLSLDKLDGGFTAFYGPNEAGKSTVLQFVRTMLYGATPERRRRYLPPVAGGNPGGCLVLQGPTETLRICRRLNGESSEGDRLQISNDHEAPRGAEDLAALLSEVDEATFNNVYAIGLRELQELGSLGDTEAASWLYSLTTGLDRVSLLEVMQYLARSRQALLSSDGSAGLIPSLAAQVDALRAELDHHAAALGQWSQLHARRDQLADAIRSLHERHSQLTHDGRTLEIAIQLAPRWQARQDLDRQLRAFAGRVRLPDDAAHTLDELQERIAAHKRDAEVFKRQRHVLREEADRLGINEVLVRNASRVEALGEQRDWLEALERQAAAIHAELSEIQSQLATENERLGVDVQAAPNKRAPEISAGLLSSLQPHAKAIRACKERLMSAERQAASRREACAEYEAQLQFAMPAASDGMPSDLEEAGELVAALRRRLQLEQRAEQSRRNKADLEQQNHELLDRQELPLWMEAAHTVLIIVGVSLLAVGLLTGAAGAAWIGGIMVAVLIALRIFKYIGEEQIAARRESIERQLDLVQKQVREAQREQEELDVQQASIEGSVVVKLQAAERHLSELEKLLPIDTKWRDARREAESAERRVEEARKQVEAARSTWRGKLAALRLPKDWTPRDLRTMAGRVEQISELRLRVARRRDDAEQRQREHATLCERIRNLAEEVGLAQEGTGAPALLAHLLSELRGHQTKVAERSRLRKRARELRSKQQQHTRAAASLRLRRDALFTQAGVDNEAAYRLLLREQQQADELQRQHQALRREMAAAIGKHAPEEAIATLLTKETVPALEARWEVIARELEENDHQLHRLAEQRGAVGQQLEDLAQDRSLAERQLDLAAIETQLADAIAVWQVHAATCTVLERIRVYYEKHRQPETLVEASRIFDNFTEGRYRRIWTPLGKCLLFVDTAEGDSLPVEALSRGTREQLFLALRLALVSLLARRGVSLPIILDDVLVNFDAQRAARAVRALWEFAKRGHQVLMFTCHEHMAVLLRSLHIDLRQLPNRFCDERAQPSVPPLPAPKPQQMVFDVPLSHTAGAATASESERDGEFDAGELEVEPPIRPAVRYAYPEDDEDTLLDVEETPAPSPPLQRPTPAPVPLIGYQSYGDWIRVGPQVRRRETLAEPSGKAEPTESDSAINGTDLEEADEEADDEADCELEAEAVESREAA